MDQLEAFTIEHFDPSHVGDIRAIYGLNLPIFEDLDGSVLAGETFSSATRVSLDGGPIL